MKISDEKKFDEVLYKIGESKQSGIKIDPDNGLVYYILYGRGGLMQPWLDIAIEQTTERVTEQVTAKFSETYLRKIFDAKIYDVPCSFGGAKKFL